MKNAIQYRSGDELSRLVKVRQTETSRFLKNLARKKPGDLDKVTHELHESFFNEFNCLDCANCCKTLGPRLTDADIERIGRYLKMKPVDFTELYLIRDEDNDLIFRTHPCPFLQPDNSCTIYELRPKACRDYPHTDRKRIYQILDITHKNAETCPVVFEIIEILKSGFR